MTSFSIHNDYGGDASTQHNSEHIIINSMAHQMRFPSYDGNSECTSSAPCADDQRVQHADDTGPRVPHACRRSLALRSDAQRLACRRRGSPSSTRLDGSRARTIGDWRLENGVRKTWPQGRFCKIKDSTGENPRPTVFRSSRAGKRRFDGSFRSENGDWRLGVGGGVPKGP